MSLTLTFQQSTGLITDEAGEVVAHAWAGHGDGLNNPAMQEIHEVGPLPQGVYEVRPWEDNHPPLGPMVAHLVQIEGETFGRDAFYIHGPSSTHYMQESKGCIVVPHVMRQKVHDLAPDFIRVVA